MPLTREKCRVCGEEVYRNSRGETLKHTTPATGGKSYGGWGQGTYVPADVCKGSTPGARP